MGGVALLDALADGRIAVIPERYSATKFMQDLAARRQDCSTKTNRHELAGPYALASQALGLIDLGCPRHGVDRGGRSSCVRPDTSQLRTSTVPASPVMTSYLSACTPGIIGLHSGTRLSTNHDILSYGTTFLAYPKYPLLLSRPVWSACRLHASFVPCCLCS